MPVGTAQAGTVIGLAHAVHARLAQRAGHLRTRSDAVAVPAEFGRLAGDGVARVSDADGLAAALAARAAAVVTIVDDAGAVRADLAPGARDISTGIDALPGSFAADLLCLAGIQLARQQAGAADADEDPPAFEVAAGLGAPAHRAELIVGTRDRIVDGAVAVVVEPVARFGRDLTAPAARISSVLVDPTIAVVVRTVADLLGRGVHGLADEGALTTQGRPDAANARRLREAGFAVTRGGLVRHSVAVVVQPVADLGAALDVGLALETTHADADLGARRADPRKISRARRAAETFVDLVVAVVVEAVAALFRGRDANVAGITLTIVVAVGLVRIRVPGTIVADVAETIPVEVRLIGVGQGGAVVIGDAELILVFVATLQPDPPLQVVAEGRSHLPVLERPDPEPQAECHIVEAVRDEVAIGVRAQALAVANEAPQRLTTVRGRPDPASTLTELTHLPVQEMRVVRVVAKEREIGGRAQRIVALVELEKGLGAAGAAAAVVVALVAREEEVSVDVRDELDRVEARAAAIRERIALGQDVAVELRLEVNVDPVDRVVAGQAIAVAVGSGRRDACEAAFLQPMTGRSPRLGLTEERHALEDRAARAGVRRVDGIVEGVDVPRGLAAETAPGVERQTDDADIGVAGCLGAHRLHAINRCRHHPARQREHDTDTQQRPTTAHESLRSTILQRVGCCAALRQS